MRCAAGVLPHFPLSGNAASSDRAAAAAGSRMTCPAAAGGSGSAPAIKGEPFAHRRQLVVLPTLYNAIGVVESLTAPAAETACSPRHPTTATPSTNALRNWVNGEQRPAVGLDPIPDGPVNPGSAAQPGTGDRPASTRTDGREGATQNTSASSRRRLRSPAGGQQASFVAESRRGEREHLRLTSPPTNDYQRGVLPPAGCPGPGRVLPAVDEILARHEPGPATVVDDRGGGPAPGHLKDPARRVANYCWFTIRKALCLQLAGTPKPTSP